MPKTTTPSSAPERVARVRRDLEALPGLTELLEQLDLYPDLEAEIGRCAPPLLSSSGPSKAQLAAGAYFSPAEVERFLRFMLKLRHTKGSRWAGRPLVPDLWQVIYVIAPVFGWRRADGNRLFRELYLEVPRKNGKSTLCAAIALFLLMADSNLKAGRLAEPGAEVYSAATTTRQAKEVFRPAEQMARRSPSLARRLAIKADTALIYDRTASRYEVVSGVPSKAEEKMGLNPSGATIDELHVHKSRDLVETIESATGAREQPLIAYITTAGLDEDGTIYAEKRSFAEAVATGEIVESQTWAVIYTIAEADLERWDQPEVWAKVNPGFGVSVSADYLEDAASKAHRNDAKRLSFLRLHLNWRTGAISRWIPADAWTKSGAFVVPADLFAPKPRLAYGGLDLANSIDLAALALVLPRWDEDPKDPSYEVEVLDVIVRAWTPRGRLADRTPRQRALLEAWAEKGLITVVDGDVIDYDEIELDVEELADDVDLRALNFDRWGSKQIIQHLGQAGLTVWEMGQGYTSMSPAMKEAERLIYQRRVRHGGNPLLVHAVKSLAIEQDAAGNVKPSRDKSTGWIDPWVALVMAIDAWSRDGSGQSAYEDRGVETA